MWVSQQETRRNVRNPRRTEELDVLLCQFEQIHRVNRTRRIAKSHNRSFTFNHLEVVVEPAEHKTNLEELMQITHVVFPTPS